MEKEAISQLAIADTIIQYLHQHVAAIGFTDAAFSLNTIDSKRDSLKNAELASDNAQQTLHEMKDLLKEAFLCYAKGQRYGFINPRKTFGANNYDISIEQPDSTFLQRVEEAFMSDEACAFLESCEPTSKAYRTLFNAYRNDTSADGKKRLLLNMERLRWRDTKAPGENERHVFVNIPAQEVWAIAPDSVFSMRICCGAPATKTPLLTSAIHLIQLNPEWNIPVSIIRKEVSRRAGDSAYFARNRYYITDRSGNQVDPKSVTSQQLASGSYRIAQQSGAGNSLGRIIFRFPNRFSVYLHDTNNKAAFNRERRTLSHGCIRLQRPFDMLQFVLNNADEWLLDRMRISIDMRPKTQRGRNYIKNANAEKRLVNSTAVSPRVPVLINYFTVYPNPETGALQTYPDRYSYDSKMAEALKPFLP